MKRLFLLGFFVITLFAFSSQIFADDYHRYHRGHPYHHHHRHYHGGYIYCDLCHLYHRSTHHHFHHYHYHDPVVVGQETVVTGERVIGTREVVE